MKFIFTILLLIPIVSKGDSYICVSELSTGFAYNSVTNQWETSDFIADSKYIVKKIKNHSYKWVVKEIGSDDTVAICDEEFSKIDHIDSEILRCESISEFKINRTNMRFINIYSDGYYDVGKVSDSHPFSNVVRKTQTEGYITPLMEIGHCSKI